MRFFKPTLIISQAMVKKSVLPMDVKFSGHMPFPLRDRAPHSWRPRKTHQGVQMIRHEHRQVYPPLASRLAKTQAFPQAHRHFRMAQLVDAFGIRTNSDNIYFPIRNP
jgi:hypothetical protein